MIKLLHFADAHIDIASRGRTDPATGLPYRTLDFLKALDSIVDAAIQEHVDLVIFAGDAYRDRTPVPTYQREWGKRILRLSQAGIQTVLVVGNHDLSPAFGRAHALHEFDTLGVPGVTVIDRPVLLKPADLDGLPVQIVALPWVSRSKLITKQVNQGIDQQDLYANMTALLDEAISRLAQTCDSALPAILAAHASIEGASYGSERSIALGTEMIITRGAVKNNGFDYVALGHIHKAQNLNENGHPPVIYPGSIERVDFGEARDQKFFVIAEVEKGKATVHWHELHGRVFIDRSVQIDNPINVTGQLQAALPPAEALRDAIIRLSVSIPPELQSMIDEQAMQAYTKEAFEFRINIILQRENRLRISSDESVGSLTPHELLSLYWDATGVTPEQRAPLDALAADVISVVENDGAVDEEAQELT